MRKNMMSQKFQENIIRYLLLASALAVFGLIVAGGILRVSDAGGVCPDWPTCFGRWTPPNTGSTATLEYVHRFLTFLAGGLLLASTSAARRDPRPGIRPALNLSLALMLLQVALGALVWRQSAAQEPAWLGALHMGLSLLIQAAILVATVSAFHPSSKPAYRTPFARLSLAVLAVIFILLMSGSLVAASPSSAVCQGWPLCNGRLFPTEVGAWLPWIHRLLVLASGVLFLLLLRQAWRSQRSQTVILVTTSAAVVLFFAQALMGSQMLAAGTTQGLPAYLVALHQATAVAVWAAVVIQGVAVGFAARQPEDELLEALNAVGRKGLVKDFLMLTKPIVVLLLLVTTYAGMVIGAHAWPSVELTFWTLLGGFMAAGGSGAINQFIDREDDQRMQRTQKRPIPSGRLTPAEGLAFGVGMALASFYLVVAFVNLLAALLTLAGIIYYVLLYSLILKKTTVQNIVIGGGAGAIPPLVGWAAATGSLNIPSLFLFAVVFMWTPPHFWALALVRKNDYARAGVPMLPVIRGERETRWQILIYTVELVSLTMLLPLFGLGGSVYLVGAAALGGWLLMAAWKVWKLGGNKIAWKMYRYSSMYLAFLFVVLMVDALL